MPEYQRENIEAHLQRETNLRLKRQSLIQEEHFFEDHPQLRV